MNVYGKSFSFNGINSSKYDVVLVGFNGAETERTTGINYTTNKTELTPFKSVTNIYNKKYDDVLRFDISICKSDGKSFTEQERREIVAWITSPVQYALFTIDDCQYDENPYHKDIEYFCTSTNYTEFVTLGVKGLTFSMECNAPYGFSKEEVTLFDSLNNVVIINNTSDELTSDYYPIIELKSNFNGEVTISNNNFPSEIMRLNLLQGQEIVINNKYGDVTDNLELFDYSTDTNLVWLRLSSGENIITITGDVVGKIKCRYVRKVGI